MDQVVPFAIEIDAVSKTYRRRKGPLVKAVVDLSLSIPFGQVFGFLGPNDAGKTTLLKMIAGMVKPTSGSLRVNGYNVVLQRELAVRQCGVVIEGCRGLHSRVSIWENLMRAGRQMGCPQVRLEERARNLLSELGLWDWRGQKVGDLSQGKRKKAAIVCALISDPPVVLFDEPTLNLDARSASTLKAWILEMAKNGDKAVVLATRQPEVALDLCDRLALMNRGRLIAERSFQRKGDLINGTYYQVRIKGHLNRRWATWFEDLTLTTEKTGDTILRGVLPDQAALHGLLAKIRDLGLPLLSVKRVDPDLEELFKQFTNESFGNYAA